MSQLQFGRNRCGLSGVLVDLPGFGTGAKYSGNAIRWNVRTTGQEKRRFGRGSTRFAQYRFLWSGGGGSIALTEIAAGTETPTGNADQQNDWPTPAEIIGATGNVIYQLRANKTITVPVLVTGYTAGFDPTKKDQEEAGGVVDYVVTGAPVFAGWTGPQPNITDPEKTDLQLYDGTVFTFDPKALQHGSRVTIDWWGSGGATDTSLVQRLQQKLLTAQPPINGLKLRPSSIDQDAPDGGTITLIWGLTDTKDDVLFPDEFDFQAVDGLGNLSTRAGLNASPINPNTSLFFSGTETRRITDGNIKIKSTFDRWGGEKNQREKTGTFVNRDVSGLNDNGEIDIVVLTANGLPADPTPPTGLQVVNRTLRNFDNTNSDAKFSLAIDTPQQTLEQDNSSQNDDPNFIDSNRATAKLDAVATRVTGFRSVGTATKLVHHNRTMYVHRMGKLDSLDRLKLSRTRTKIDRSAALVTSLDDEDVEVKEWLTTDTPPTAPDFVPSNNTKLLYYIDEPVYPAIDGVPGLNVRVFFYGSKSTRDQLVLENTDDNTDASAIQSTAVRAYLDGESVPADPVGMVERFRRTKTLTVGLAVNRILTVKVYGLVTVQQEMENEGTIYNADPIDVFKSRTTTIVTKTTDIATMAAALALANPDANVAIKPLASTNALVAQIIEKSGEDKKIIAGGSAVRRVPMRGVPVGTIVGGVFTGIIPATSFNNTAAYVKAQVYGRAAGGLGGRIFIPTEIDRALSSFIWRRTINTLSPWTYYHSDLIGKLNNAPFLGYPAYNVRYMGPKVLFTTAIAYAHLAIIDFIFETDNGMFVNDSAIDIGEGGTNSSPTLAGTGFYSATIFGATNLLAWLPSVDFSVFLSATLL